MPVYTCEFTHNGKRHMLTNLAQDAEWSRLGFEASLAGFKGNKKQLHLDTMLDHGDDIHKAHVEAQNFAVRNGLPPIDDTTQARVAKEIMAPLAGAPVAKEENSE